MGKMAVNMEKQLRKLDTAKEATIDLVALNNTVVNMRSVVKAAKVQVIHKLSRMIQKLKTKKGTEQQKEKNLRKAQRMLDEIFAIKELNADSVTKFALANKTTFDDVCKQPSVSAEARSLLRLSEHQLLANKVKAFRIAHDDWEELAAYLTTKQTGRRFRTREQKERASRKGSKFVYPLDGTAGQAAGQDKPGSALTHGQDTASTLTDRDSGQASAGTSKKQGRGETEHSSERTDKHKDARTTSLHGGSDGALTDDSADSSQENDDADVDSSSDNDALNTRDGDGDSDVAINAHSSTNSQGADLDRDRGDDDVSKTERDSDDDAVETDSQAEDDDSDKNSNDDDTDDDSEDKTDKHDSDNEEDSDTDSDSADDDAQNESDGDNDRDSSDDGDDSDKLTSGSKALSLLTKAPPTSSLVEDPFFMGDPADDADQPHHWIEQETVERMGSYSEFRGGYSRAGRGRGGHSQAWRGKGGHSWTHPEGQDEDDRWLRGDGDHRERGRGRGRGHRDGLRGRGTFSARGGSSRGRRDQDQGGAFRGRGRGSQGHDKSRRSEGSGPKPFRGQGRRDNFSGHGHKEKSSLEHGSRGKKRGGDSGPKVEDPTSHPSWDASRKRKMLEQTASFSGKHIKFDDD
ncbi:uncharacterized protein LOC143282484 [Babylonia areolata]|uniref:uncharacterized protein LOC143282484 n=1 Tax=Babylonia areolata TaxID=304850 RepID=UPI003FD46A9B